MTPHTIPDLKKQVQEEYTEELTWLNTSNDINEILNIVIDRTLAFAKEATLLEEKETEGNYI